MYSNNIPPRKQLIYQTHIKIKKTSFFASFQAIAIDPTRVDI